MFANGELVRIRRGVYCVASLWVGATDRERHIAYTVAAARHAVRPFVVAGNSAAALWGMPIGSSFGKVVTVVDVHRGGGRSEPGVRRVTSGASAARPVSRHGLDVTELARTALDVARPVPFQVAVGSVDWALWRKNPLAVSREQLLHCLETLSPVAFGAHLRRVVDFATDLSDSFGESTTRSVIHELGFAAPVLQLELVDSEGRMLPDFAWPDQRVLLEFDGDVKFTDASYNGGDPLGKLKAMRRRDARLRRLGWTVIHVEWSEVMNPARIAALLDEAGVPRRGI